MKPLEPLRVTLVTPPFEYFPGMRSSAEEYTRPPLGIAYLAAYAKERFGKAVDIRLVDCVAAGLHTPALAARGILETRPRAVGFSVVTGNVRAAEKTALLIKEAAPETVVVMGGPHATALPEEVLAGADVKVIGEGEHTFAEWIESALLGRGGDTRAMEGRPVPGAFFFSPDGLTVRGAPRNLEKNLDVFPPPARELLPVQRYFHSYPHRAQGRFTTLFTARGCAYSCSFCANQTLWGRNVRRHSPERVAMELDLLGRQGYGLLFFDDDTFTLDRRRAMETMAYLRRRHPRMRWICHTRADTLDAELVREMRASGCVEVQIGVESGDEEVLAATGKGITTEDARRAFALLRGQGIATWATFILGNAGETPESIRASMRLAREINPTYATFITLLPLPGTRIFEEYKAAGYLTTLDWGRYTWHGEPVISLPGLDSKALAEARRRAFLGFYLRPGKLFQSGRNTLRSLSFREMRRNFNAWRILTSR
jgi:radical SAM superfamily enzyme YgiQ (UPF0313 family)